jgi:hypothetical protein
VPILIHPAQMANSLPRTKSFSGDVVHGLLLEKPLTTYMRTPQRYTDGSYARQHPLTAFTGWIA